MYISNFPKESIKMKKFLAMLCALLMCCFMGGCGEKEKNVNSSEPTNSGSGFGNPDLDSMTEEELDDYFSSYPFDFDEPIVLPDDE